MWGAVIIVYDGDGNRVAETVGGTSTKFLVDRVSQGWGKFPGIVPVLWTALGETTKINAA